MQFVSANVFSGIHVRAGRVIVECHGLSIEQKKKHRYRGAFSSFYRTA